MKLVINYDLINKVKEAKGKFVMRKNTIKAGIIALVPTVVVQLPFSPIVPAITCSSVIISMVCLGVSMVDNYFDGDLQKKRALQTLKNLSEQLKTLHVETSDILLLESSQYRVEYERTMKYKIIPWIKQNKYILVPVYDNGDIKEVSLLQEHELFSKEYILSHGSPSRVLKPAFNNV